MSFRYYNPNQTGGMLVYTGSRQQRGGMAIPNIGKTLKRVFLPIGRALARRGAKVGKDLAKRGVKVGVGAITDRLRGGPAVSMKEALKKRTVAAADKAVVDYLGEADRPDIPFLSQDGMGLRGKRRKRKATRKSINKGRKRVKRLKSKPKKKKKKSKTSKRKSSKKRSRRRDIFS